MSTSTTAAARRDPAGPRIDGAELLPGRLHERLVAALAAVERTGCVVAVAVQANGRHGARVTIRLDSRVVTGPVAPELAIAFAEGLAEGARLRRG